MLINRLTLITHQSISIEISIELMSANKIKAKLKRHPINLPNLVFQRSKYLYFDVESNFFWPKAVLYYFHINLSLFTLSLKFEDAK